MDARTMRRAVALVVAYVITARLGLSFDEVDGVATLVWPPSGIALAALVGFGLELWPAVALGALITGLSTSMPLHWALVIAVGNTLEGVLGAMLLQHFRRTRKSSVHSLRPTLGGILLAAVSCPLVSAAFGVTAVHLAGFLPREMLGTELRNWWLGNAVAIVLITPALLAWPSVRGQPWSRRRVAEACVLAAALVLAGVFVFGTAPDEMMPRSYFVFPPLLWAALRFASAGASLGSLLTATLAIVGTQAGLGPFAEQVRPQGLLELQAFMAIVAVSVLSIGALAGERRAAMGALTREHSFVSAILDAAGLLVVLDRHGRIEHQNRACERLMGPNVQRGRPFYEVFSEERQRDEVERAIATVVRTKQPTGWESKCTSVSGSERTIVWSVSAMLREDGEVEHLIASGNDVTDRRQLESQLIAADRLAAVGALAAGVGHEINNPLAYTMMSVELALKQAQRARLRAPEEAAEIEALLGTALEGTDRVRRIVGDLKSLARAQDEERGAVDVHAVLEACIPMAYNEIRHRARLIKDYGEVPAVYANDGRLSQVFLNLLVNAAQAIPEGQVETNEVRVRTRVGDDGRVVIEVSDTGSGIPLEARARLFEPFFTTKPMGVGVGLGLSVCHAIVTSFGGRIDVDSEPDKGTTFRVTLEPAAAAEERTPSSPPAHEEQRKHEPLRILIADDERELARSLALFLGQHEVDVATSGREALERCKQQDYDLIFCDLLMPDLTGMDVYEALAREQPGLEKRMVFMTGGAFTARAQAFLEKVDNPRLEKPFAPDEMVQLVSTHTRAEVRPYRGEHPAHALRH